MTDKPKIIGISGKIGTGKTYIAENILPNLLSNKIVPFYIAYGDQLKNEIYSRDTTDITSYNTLYVKKTPETRLLLQRHGTDIGRAENENIWIRSIDMWINIYNKRFSKMSIDVVFIIPDVRFKNEADYIKDNGGILINIVAPNRNEQKLLEESLNDSALYSKIKNHKSETDLDNYEDFTCVINNDEDNKKIIDTLYDKLIEYNYPVVKIHKISFTTQIIGIMYILFIILPMIGGLISIFIL